MAPIAAAQAAAPVAVSAAPSIVASETPVLTGDAILSPMVGTFYSAPSPDSAPFVKVGERVKKGQVIAVLEAMKIMNELEAEFDCKILSVLISDGDAVEYDMPLFAVEKL
ncbi:MAG: acetyl-CoA carboxylase, biotin carboxyl carrier protein [Campylobacterales bacterium 16-40-21]|nr:MAG: acetyl-CoA carboxylase, biotin carboxyl carrier protein [Campylobacterales bacterium 16-40-21]